MKKMTREKAFEYLPEKWEWIAMDKDGDWAAYSQVPDRLKTFWIMADSEGDYANIAVSIDYTGPWEDSLMERPREKVLYYIDCGEVILTTEPKVIIHCYEAPHMVADWFHKVMEESK